MWQYDVTIMSRKNTTRRVMTFAKNIGKKRATMLQKLLIWDDKGTNVYVCLYYEFWDKERKKYCNRRIK